MANVNLTSPETVARAVTGVETSPAVGPVNPQDLAARRITQEAIEKGPRTAIESIGLPPLPDQRTADNFINRHFYSEYNNTGARVRRAGSESLNRYQEAQQRETIARTYVERGFDALNNNQRDEAITFAREALERWPEARALFNTINPANTREARIRETVRNMLRDPNFKVHAQTIFAEAFDPSKMPDIDPLMRAKLTRAEQNRTERRDSLNANGAERTAVANIIQTLRNPGTPDGLRLQTLRSARPTLEQDQRNTERQINNYNDLINQRNSRLNSPSCTDPAERTQLTNEINTLTYQINRVLTPELITTQTELGELRTLEDRLSGAEQERRRLVEESETLRQRLTQAEEEYDAARIGFESSQNTHDQAEQQFNDKLRDVFREGMQRFLEKRIGDIETAQGKLIEQDANVKDPVEGRITTYLDQRYQRFVQRGGVRRLWNPSNREFNRGVINADYRTLVNQGPDLLLRQVIGSTQMTDERGNPRPQMTNAEVDAWIAANGEAANRLKAQVVEKVMTERIQTGNFTAGDARYIAGASWGKDIINKAIANRDRIRGELQALQDSGEIRGNPSEWLREQIRSNPAFWLMILLGGGAIGAIAPALIAGGIAGLGVSTLSTAGAVGGAMGAGATLAGPRIAMAENEN